MAAEIKQEIALEIAHVLFIDIVAYSKMAMDDQRAAIEKLNQIVQSTDEYRKAESENRLLKIADDTQAVETQVYQSILERQPAQIIPRLKEILAKPDPALGFTM